MMCKDKKDNTLCGNNHTAYNERFGVSGGVDSCTVIASVRLKNQTEVNGT